MKLSEIKLIRTTRSKKVKKPLKTKKPIKPKVIIDTNVINK